MSLVKHILFWTTLSLMMVLLSSLFVDPVREKDRLASEMNTFSELHGAAAFERAASRLIRTKLLLASAMPSLDSTTPTAESASLSGKFSTLAKRFAGVVEVTMTRWLWRIVAYADLVVPVLMLTVAAACDGLVCRRVKSYTFGYTNPVTFSINTHLLIVLCVAPFFALASPWQLPLWMIAVWVALLPPAVWLAASNLQAAY